MKQQKKKWIFSDVVTFRQIQPILAQNSLDLLKLNNSDTIKPKYLNKLNSISSLMVVSLVSYELMYTLTDISLFTEHIFV